MRGTINGIGFEADSFFYDGCHKIYLADSDESYEHMFGVGWDEGDLYPIEDLPVIWTCTCPLRFIQSGDLSRSYVRQCEPVVFDGWDMGDELRLEIAYMNDEQRLANGDITEQEFADRWTGKE